MNGKYIEIFSLYEDATGKPEKISLINLNNNLNNILQDTTLVEHAFNASTYLGLYYQDYVYFSPVTRTGLLNYINYLKSSEFSEANHLDYLQGQLEFNKQQAIQRRNSNYESV